MIKRLLATALAAAVLAAPLRAQAVSGRFVESGGAPVPAARVLLQDESGRTVHSALTGADGQFSLRAPAAGRYVVRAERIGYASTVSEPLQLAAGETATQRLVAVGQRVMLDAIVVSAEARCSVRPGGDQTAAVWGEVRKALDAVSATTGDQRARFAVELFERDVDSGTGSVTADNRRRVEGMAHKPFVTVDPERLSNVGFVEREGEGYLYAAPDADVLLSDRFLEEHCFRLRTAGAPSQGLIGLAFEPVRGRRVSDVQGVLWVDRASAELRLMEFEYTRPPLRGPRGVPGGRMEFQRLPDGRWITSSWVIRMPVEQAVTQSNVLVPQAQRLAAIREVGGSIVAPGSGAVAAATPPAGSAPRITVETGPPPPAAPEPSAPTAEQAAAAVSSQSQVMEAAAAPAAGDRRRLIGRAEVERTTVSSAFDLVQSLRPQWMRARGADALRTQTVETLRGAQQAITDESAIIVYVDGRRLGNLDMLRTVSYGDIDRVEYYDGVEAQQRWGTGHSQGVIHVITRH